MYIALCLYDGPKLTFQMVHSKLIAYAFSKSILLLMHKSLYTYHIGLNELDKCKVDIILDCYQYNHLDIFSQIGITGSCIEAIR